MDLNISSDFAIAKAKLELLQLQQKAAQYSHLKPEDAQLRAALQFAIEAPLRVPEEHARIEKALRTLSKNKDNKYLIRVGYLEYQADLAVWQANRAKELGEMRLAHISKIITPEQIQEERQRCLDDTLFWFKYYAWTYDPRSIVYASPFDLFDYQKPIVKDLEDYIFVVRNDLLIEKTRDEGVTWIVSSVFAKHWLFKPSSNQVHFLCGSKKQDDVDSLGNPSTIFEKIRYQIAMQPSWFQPEGLIRKKHLTYLSCVNPETGSSIVGESANPDFSRSGRYTAILKDESASWESDEAADAAASQSTNTKIDVSTPKGKMNRFYKIRESGDVHVITCHWKNHPWKDDRWYKAQGLKMSPEMVAQELDINYEASQPGRVYPHYNELYHVITWQEFASKFPDAIVDANTAKQRYRIPPTWLLARGQDWGSTTEHPCVTLWFATAPANAKELAGSIFVYRQFIPLAGATPRQVAHTIAEFEAIDKEYDRMVESRMSHEAKSVRDTYSVEHGLQFEAWSTDPVEGIAMVSDYLEVDFKDYAHPFRPNLEGRPRLYIIVDDDEGYLTQVNGKYSVKQGQGDKGMQRLREEFGVYHYPASEPGKAIQRHKPDKSKGFDDAMDVIRCLAKHYFAPIGSKSKREQIEEALPESLQTKTIVKQGLQGDDLALAWFSQAELVKEIEKKMQPAGNWRANVFERAGQ